MYRGVVIHELGHFVDNMTDQGLTDATISTLLAKMPQRDIPEFVKKVSGYSSKAGPKEAAPVRHELKRTPTVAAFRSTTSQATTPTTG